MDLHSPERKSTVIIESARGSVVVLPSLSAAQRDAALATFATADPDMAPAPVPVLAGDEEYETCNNCHGKGSYEEMREQETASGGKVVVKVTVSCRPCKGEGRIRKRK
jgi:cytochrome c5